ncbi:MAG: U32 family peptidase [Lachnospiraceae bacterium]|uniref:U32 family peptidase n=1 Tax=Candidatus Weimeria bifida TaxID=2599074 RepID=A0A6N7IYW9_9FIRM|nr:U32 family peptidase [Candidatus Weimeria bifida]RRF96362.1 MAG: U32 family peptidase [Lachnospiraceae bacterium]
MDKLPELLAPAANLSVLKTAVRYGADAVYLGGESFGLRAGADNFTNEEIVSGIKFAHDRGCKVYITVNIFAHDRDLEGVREYLKELNEMAPDGLLIADPGIFMMAKELITNGKTDLHISTQSNNTNYEIFKFWHSLGAKRVVGARELSLAEIKDIRAHIPDDLEMEIFVHGAMCISYSGRCLLSNYFTGRDANQGQCTHPCRWKYALVEETRPGEYLPVEENDRGTYIMNSKDLNMVGHLDDLVDAGVDSLKIEGRMKTDLYVGTVVRAYRMALDDLAESVEKYRNNIPKYEAEIRECTYRQFSTGFFYGKPGAEAQIYNESTYEKGATYIGEIEEIKDGFAKISQKNKFSVGETIEIMKPNGDNIPVKIDKLLNADMEAVKSAPHPKETIYFKVPEEAEPGDLLRRKEVV